MVVELALSIEKVIKYNPKKIFGIDISEVSIEKAKKEQRLNICKCFLSGR